jgi:GntR family transcriptional regulator
MEARMPVLLSLDPSSDLPLYAQIVEGIKRACALGRLSEGDTLPPIRRMAEELKVDSNTVVRAYRLLAAEGFLQLRRGRGTKILRSANRPEALQRAKTFEILLDRLAIEGELLGLTREDILFAVESHLKLFRNDDSSTRSHQGTRSP